MSIASEMEEKLNSQINKEFYSAYLYLSMSFQAQEMQLRGFAHWFRVQSNEELGHALKMAQYLIDRGGTVELSSVVAAQSKWATVVEMFKCTCEQEAIVSAKINELMQFALETKDYAACQFLGWFVQEQVEEEAQASEILGELELSIAAPEALLILDRELGEREDSSCQSEE